MVLNYRKQTKQVIVKVFPENFVFGCKIYYLLEA